LLGESEKKPELEFQLVDFPGIEFWLARICHECRQPLFGLLRAFSF